MRVLALVVSCALPLLDGCAAASLAATVAGSGSNPCEQQILSQTDAKVWLKPGNRDMCHVVCTGQDRVPRRLTVRLKVGETKTVSCPSSGQAFIRSN